MAESDIIVIDSDDESPPSCLEKSTKENAQQTAAAAASTAAAEKELMECPICLQTCIHPARLPCGHIFCFLCVKGVAYKNRRCAMCRREIPLEFLDHPQLVYGVQDTNSSTTEDGYLWFYEGRNGWWQYDERTCQEIEEAFQKGDKFCTILVASYVYTVDFETMLQQRQNDPSRKRQVKRDLATIQKKGVAGLRIDGTADLSRPSTSSAITTIAATDAAIRIASDIIDSTLAHADEYYSEHNELLRRASNSSSSSGTNSSTTTMNTSTPSRRELLDEVEENLHLLTNDELGTPNRRELLDEVEETLNISNLSSINLPPLNLDGFFSSTIDEFRTLALSNIAESSSDSDNNDDDDDNNGHHIL